MTTELEHNETHHNNHTQEDVSNLQVLNLTSIDFTNFQHKLTSPRSLEACRRLGIDIKELYFVDLHTFRNSNFELRHLAPECLKLRYDHFEKLRMKSIANAKEERKKIIDQEEKKKSHSQSQSKAISLTNDKSMTSEKKLFSTAIEIERKEIEKIKFKQKKEIEAMIEYEIKMELIRKNNMDKIRRQQEKVEVHMKEVDESRKREEAEKKRREDEKAERLRKDEEELRKTYKEKMEKEQKRISEIVKMEQEKQRESALKNIEQRKKQEKFRDETETILREQQLKAQQKQKELEVKDQKRREALEAKRCRDIATAIKAKLEHQKKIELTRRNLDSKLEKQKHAFSIKQKNNDDKRRIFEEQQSTLYRRKKMESIARENEIKRVLEYNKELEKSKVVNYYKKQELIKKHKTEIEKERLKEHNKHLQHIEHRHMTLQQGKVRNDKQEVDKKTKILNKIKQTDGTIQKQRMENERKFMMRQEEDAMMEMQKKTCLKRLERINDYEMQKKLEEIHEKEKRMNEIKKEKYSMLCKKREMAEEVARQKKEVKERFDIVLKKHRGINEEALNELFPDDKELVKRLMDMKNSINKEDFNNSSRLNKSNMSNSYKNTSMVGNEDKRHSNRVNDTTQFARTGEINDDKMISIN